MNPHTKYEALCLHMVDISFSCTQTYMTEGYRYALETDDVEPSAIMDFMIRRLYDDIEETGITFTTTLGDIFSNGYQIEQVLTTLELILPKTLFNKIKSDAIFKNALKTIFIDGIDDDAVSIVNYLDYIINDEVLSEKYGEGASILIDHVTNNEIFDTYIRSMLSDTPVVSTTIDPVATTKCINAFMYFREKADYLINYFNDNYAFSKSDHFKNALMRITHSFNDPLNTPLATWLYSQERKDLSAYEQGAWDYNYRLYRKGCFGLPDGIKDPDYEFIDYAVLLSSFMLSENVKQCLEQLKFYKESHSTKLFLLNTNQLPQLTNLLSDVYQMTDDLYPGLSGLKDLLSSFAIRG